MPLSSERVRFRSNASRNGCSQRGPREREYVCVCVRVCMDVCACVCRCVCVMFMHSRTQESTDAKGIKQHGPIPLPGTCAADAVQAKAMHLAAGSVSAFQNHREGLESVCASGELRRYRTITRQLQTAWQRQLHGRHNLLCSDWERGEAADLWRAAHEIHGRRPRRREQPRLRLVV